MSERACPTCAKPEQPEHSPFCSRRCAQVDLNRWFTGRYAIPAAEGETEASDEDPEGQG